MRNSITTIALLGLLLLLLVAPFSALAPLILIAAVFLIARIGWTVFQILATGEERDRPASDAD
ncbi:hypothetical protein [Thermocoleostomius sinensis]|jgi:hypothetical protein|uniref:Uncharacterized protein n=1 Tax=Thermocoleostomius sinensis A174 TaxID=2016057 RepID=A0A9E8ZI17_9CYAN|nr:hypothetical protein [Thermocoleostomius sinensis]WAL62097.1 hypothetical protein OXH18_08955 [Thermocoleostomius sinensis A174]